MATTEEIQMAEKVLNGTNKSCLTCVHAEVCSPFRGIARFMAEYKKSETENLCFEAYEIAKICKQYLSVSVIKTLQEGS